MVWGHEEGLQRKRHGKNGSAFAHNGTKAATNAKAKAGKYVA
jgi:hypothetical protein